MVDELLGACYELDVLRGDKTGLLALLSSPYAQNMKDEGKKRLPAFEAVNAGGQKCFISKKYAEYLRLL